MTQFKILKQGQTEPVFVGPKEIAYRCIEQLRKSFFFVAGSAQKRTDEFPYSIHEL